MNIDRPLDDLVKDSLKAKRAEKAAKKKEQLESKKKSQTPQSSSEGKKPSKGGDTKGNNLRVKGPIGKKRRPKKNNNKNRPSNSNVQLQDITEDDIAEAYANSASRKPGPSHINRSTKNRLSGTKIVVSNLHPDVTEDDIAELFGTVGSLKNARLMKYGNRDSIGEAEVVFENMADALEAIKRYNMVPLDNQPLHITLVTASASAGKQQQQRRPNRTNQRKPSPDNGSYEDRDQSPRNGGGGGGFRQTSPDDDRSAPGHRNGSNRRPMKRRNNRRNYNRGLHNDDIDDRRNRTGRDGYAD